MNKEETLKDLIENDNIPIVYGFDGTTGKKTNEHWMICVHQFENCKYQQSVGDGAFQICKNYPKCLNEGCYIENNM